MHYIPGSLKKSSISAQNHYGSAEMATPSSDDMYMINGTNKDNTRRDISHYNVDASNQWLQNIWILNYGIRGMAGYEGSEKLQKLDAEAHFLRAFQAFDLVKYWGDVPFKTTYSKDYSSAYTARVDRDQIFDQMVEDLNFAKEHLPWACYPRSRPRHADARITAACRPYLGYGWRQNSKCRETQGIF